MRIETLAEYDIGSDSQTAIRRLLAADFPGFAKQQSMTPLPHCRYLVWLDNELIAHVGIHYRQILNGDRPARIFGISHLCVAKAHRSQRIATILLNQIESLAYSGHVEFLLLFAEDARLFATNDYQQADNPCRWVQVEDSKMVAIAEGKLTPYLMVKPLSSLAWQPGVVDLLGPAF